MADVPVVAIDGPAASGKGTVARRVADALGWHYLDSGALYRLVALKALRTSVDPDDAQALGAIAGSLDCDFQGDRLMLDGDDVTEAVRDEAVSATASRVAVTRTIGDARCGRIRRQRCAKGPVPSLQPALRAGIVQ